MPKLVMLPEKVAYKDLKPGDHITINDMMFRVVENYRSSNPGAVRMLMLAYHTHLKPDTFKFHPVEWPDTRVDVFRMTE